MSQERQVFINPVRLISSPGPTRSLGQPQLYLIRFLGTQVSDGCLSYQQALQRSDIFPMKIAYFAKCVHAWGLVFGAWGVKQYRS